MTGFLIDSDILMDFFKKKKEVVELVIKLSREGRLAISILSIAELRSGWSREEAKFFLPRLRELVKIQDVTIKIAELAGGLRYEYKRKGINLPMNDTLIAGTAIVEEYQLVTRNKKDYPMPQIKLYST